MKVLNSAPIYFLLANGFWGFTSDAQWVLRVLSSRWSDVSSSVGYRYPHGWQPLPQPGSLFIGHAVYNGWLLRAIAAGIPLVPLCHGACRPRFVASFIKTWCRLGSPHLPACNLAITASMGGMVDYHPDDVSFPAWPPPAPSPPHFNLPCGILGKCSVSIRSLMAWVQAQTGKKLLIRYLMAASCLPLCWPPWS